MAVEHSPTSFLNHAELFQIGDVLFWERSNPPDIEPDGSDTIYTVKSNDRFDLLAHRFYGDSQLWWVIARVNDLRILPTQLFPGSQIRIPTRARLVDEGHIPERGA